MAELTRWYPFADLADLRSRFDRILGEMSQGESHWAPSVDLIREKDRLVLRADVPGIEPDDVKIEVEDDVLTVSGEHTEEKEEKEKHYVRRERRFGSFSRSLNLPAGVDPEQIEAECENGVCEIAIPLPKQAEKKAVKIKSKGA